MTRSTILLLTVLVAVAGRVCAQDGFCMVNGTTTGGAGGPTVTVTNGTDFNTQINLAGPRIVQVQGPINIGRIFTTSDKSIIGLGTNAMLLGNLNISGVSNVIVQNLRVSNPGGDGLTIWTANHVWVGHCTFYDCGDGCTDTTQGSDYVTISWCKYFYVSQLEHRFVMICGNTPDTQYHTTLHHNWYGSRADQRMAASSFARVHFYNNYFNCTNNSYCSDARTNTEFVVEDCYYSGVKSPVYADDNGKIKTTGNVYSGTSGNPAAPGTDTVFVPPYAYSLDAVASVPGIVMAGAGASGSDTVAIPSKIWDGGGSDNNLTTANNWGFGGGYNENPKSYDTLLFAGGTRLSPNNNFTANTEFTALNFSNNAGTFVLGGNALRLGQGVTNDSPAVQTINLNLDFAYAADHFGTNRSFNVTATNGSLVVNGSIAGATNGYGRIYSVTKLGPGLLTFAGINTFAANLNLNGGMVRFSTLNTNLMGSLGIANQINLDGGGLQWAAGNTADVSTRPVTILAGGAMLDVGVNNVAFANAIGNNGAGALTKIGGGTLMLNGNNSYSGNTLISQGVLALGVAGALLNSSRIILSNSAALDVSTRSDGTFTLGSGKFLAGNGTVRGSVTAASGATIAPGFSIGTLIITNLLTFQVNSTNVMELDASIHTNDLITGMISVNYGGRLIVTNLSGPLTAGDSFKLFSAGSYNGTFTSLTLPALTGNLLWTNRLALDGTIVVLLPVNTAPTNLTVVVAGNSLQLFWPDDYIGWRLEVQTNTLISGLGTNWATVLGSTATNQMTLPISQVQGSVFYRMAYQ